MMAKHARTDHNLLWACSTYQRNKRKSTRSGHLLPKVAEATLWAKMCIDLIGLYKIRCKGKLPLECICVTMMDPASGCFKIKQYNNKCTITVTNIVEQEWLTHYPWPTQITYDRGNKFVRHEFRHMITHDYGIKPKPIFVRNPQANAIVERIHQVVANIIWTFKLGTNYLDVEEH